MKPHAFVVMPFGKKPGPDGVIIDFNAVYQGVLKPAIEAAGMEVFRADQEQSAGDIKTDMFQELLIADLVVADLSMDNPNVGKNSRCATLCGRVAWSWCRERASSSLSISIQTAK